MKSILAAIAALSALLAIHLPAVPAFAHVNLSASDPAPDATVEVAEGIRLEFSGRIQPHFVRVAVTGAEQGPVEVSISTPEGDTHVVEVVPDAPLQPDTYEVGWRVVASDGHRIEGSFSFTLR